MAIYRNGQASMDADGYITGYGTKWKTALTLIRPGATIVFASNPVAYATISEIVNDTSMRATSTGGAVVPRGDYVILLHDSITVDGLAQDVAETLRYYQGKETMYEQFVEFLKGFDWQRMEQLGEKVHSDARAAEASANAAKASETNANDSKNAAAGSATTASQKATEAANSAGAAKTSETNANASKTAAANSATAAANSATTAGQYKDAAAASASAARTSEGNASSSKNAAAASASAAKTSETNAKASETSATASKNAAKTSEDNAAASKNAAASSASAASGSATAAAGSATKAKQEADRAADLAKQLDATNLMRKDANLSDVVDKSAGRKNLEVDRVLQFGNGETQIKSGDETKQIFIKNSGSWGVWDQANNVAVPLGVGHGGTGASDVNGARANLKVDKHIQGSDRTLIQSPQVGDDRYALMVHQSGVWGCYNEKNSQYVALKIDQGGTGAKDAAGARKNLQVDRFNQDSTTETRVLSADGAQALVAPNGRDWGLYRFGSGWVPLGVSQGGTGAKDAAGARTNLGLGSAATKDVGANIGNVLGVGYFGFGTPGTNILASTESGFYGVDGSGTAWAPQAGSGIVCGYDPARRQQIFTGVSGNLFVRNLASSAMNTPSSTIPWTQMQAVGTSDINFKKDITELDTEIALANIDAMEFVSFRYKDDDSEAVRRGVIAQQVEKIDPQYVHSAEGVGKMTLDINPLLMDALASIKALRARDEESKERIAKLEGEVDELKAMVAALIAK